VSELWGRIVRTVLDTGRVRIVAYRDFWDFPRTFIVKWRKRLVMFDCPFDDAAEDYGDHFAVYVLPMTLAGHLSRPTSSWVGASGMGEYIGEAAIKDVDFDRTRRWSIDDGILTTLFPTLPAASR